MTTEIVQGKTRTETGKKSVKAIRREGQIPCVIYGGEKVVHFSTDFKNVKKLIYTPDFKIAEIEVGGNKHKCIIKNVQFHPVKESILHIDFQELVEGKPVKTFIPLHIHGDSPGVKAGGVLNKLVRKAEVKVKPEFLVSELLVDISNLELGHSIRIKELDVPEGVEIMNEPGIPVCAVAVPRVIATTDEDEEEEEDETTESDEGSEE